MWRVLVVMGCVSFAQGQTTRFATPQAAEKLNALVKKAADDAKAKFNSPPLKPEEFAITLIDMRDPEHLKSGSFNGETGIYPASVIKLFYLVAAHRWMEDGKLKDSPEVEKTLRDMIVDSSNEATGKIIDLLSETTAGEELPEAEMKEWAAKRNLVNEYFKSLGYTGINVCQRTYAGSSPMGRESVFLKMNGGNRNKLTTNATARLLSEIVLHKAVTSARCDEMLKLLSRDMAAKGKGPDDQAHGFTAIALDPKDELWSKAGWTNTSRHDAAYVETSDGFKFILVTFTDNHAKERQIIPTIAKTVMEGLRAIH